ncbi:MAG: phosphate acyltransferase PlsX, partial [Oscillospiraceae bacterium]|nr:phosphate acyltransferase PlsX [Oscillospiraceae bacterium]
MKIILDAMSGDNAPLEIIKGAIMAINELNTDLVITGSREIIESVAAENNLDLTSERLEIVHTTEIITMDDAMLSVKRKKDSSMSVGLQMLSDGLGDAFVSAGNTGALYAGASLIVLRIKGFRKAAIAQILPFEKPCLLIDAGANINVTEENLEQFAIMGSIYMQKIFNVENPEVGLLNNGTERSKGTQVLQDTYVRLSEMPEINFVGNVESKQLPFGVCDVIVTDGFTGNVVLKLVEGLGAFFMTKLKDIFYKNPITKVSAAMIKKDLNKFKQDFDPSEHGGAPFLGISKPVIKAHGSSDALAIKNAVKQAIGFINTELIYEIAKHTIEKAKDSEEE